MEPSQGVILAEVRKGSLAERGGLRKHDIVLRLNEKPVTGAEAFRDAVHETIEKGFTLEALRRGKHEKVKMEPVK